MQDEQKFREKFAEIIDDTSKSYPPEAEELCLIQTYFEETIRDWEDEIKEQKEVVISDYKKCLDSHRPLLWELKHKVNPGPFSPQTNLPDNTPRSKQISELFFYASLVRLESFFVEYLEKEPPINQHDLTDKHPHCTSKDFKTDISELCSLCPLTDKINEGILKKIVFQANEQMSILTTGDFIEYLNKEIEGAGFAMKHAFDIEGVNKDYKTDPARPARIELYIWNKERTKALTRLKVEKEGSSSEAKEKINSGNTLEWFFNKTSQYKSIMEILVTQGKCQPNTYFWKDKKSGYKNLIAAILKDLHLKGYLKGDKPLTGDQIREVSQNTFAVKIGERVPQTAVVPSGTLDFIPYSSTLT